MAPVIEEGIVPLAAVLEDRSRVTGTRTWRSFRGIVVRYKPVALTAEKYDATNRQLEEAGVQWPPEGLDYHVCFGDGREPQRERIWDSREQWQAFGEHLMPVLSAGGIEFSGEPEVFEVPRDPEALGGAAQDVGAAGVDPPEQRYSLRMRVSAHAPTPRRHLVTGAAP